MSGTKGSGTVFFVNCPLRCVYCQNAEIANGRYGIVVDEDDLVRIMLNLQGQGALNVNFVTPTHYTLAICGAVRRARLQGLEVPVVWNTSGYERVQTVEALDGTVDIFLADYKYADESIAQRYSRAADYPEVALSAIEAMVRITGELQFAEEGGETVMKRGVIVRHLVLPGALENSKRSIKKLYSTFGDSVLYSIMNQYTPVMSQQALSSYPELASRVADREYEEVLDFADSLGIEDYFWQDGPAAAESFIPAWDGTGVAC